MTTVRRHAWRPRQQADKGFILIALLALLTMGGLYFLVSNLTPEAIEARRAAKTEAALVQARDALIGYALKYRDTQVAKDLDSTGDDDRVMYGYLPLPDLGSSRNQNIDPNCKDASNNPLEGCDANTFTGIIFDANKIGPTVVGRVPWRTLGTGPLRDGHGECLWLIVSSLHSRIQGPTPTLPPMNWDTLGQLDIVTANGTSALTSALATHDRPVAIIYSPGPPFPGQDRGVDASGDIVTECGGNYNAANYLDPATASALGGITNYLAGTNAASGSTGDSDPANDPDTPKGLLTQGKVFVSGGNYLPNACQGSDCTLAANDLGLPITSDLLFGGIRKSANFRTDINSMLDRMVSCLRDEIAAGGGPTGYAKIAGADSNTCYGTDVNPLGYYPHYRELAFVARGATSVNGDSCAGALLFANQRGAGQLRDSVANKNDPSKYLEDINLTSFSGAGTTFSGPEKFERVSATQSISRDIVRCIPTTQNLVPVNPPAATGVGQLASYTPSTSTLTLGREVSTALDTSVAGALYGCAWRPETHAMGSGFRSYFKFRIDDSLVPGVTSPRDGFTFAMVDGDNNSPYACGAARQHLGYSGNNASTPFISAPKIGFEVDLRVQGTFNPNQSDTLSNGRNDLSYTGGHVALAYWGGETEIATTSVPPCAAPRIEIAGICYLPQEQDDNVHGQTASTRTGFPAPPPNPTFPAIPTLGAGVYKLDSGSSTPTNLNIHVRVEVSRTPATYTLPTVRAASTTNVNLSAPGGIYFDGVAPSNGDRILVKDQSNVTENGIYVWNVVNSAIVAMTRAADADTAVELAGLLVEVQQGSQNARRIFRQTTTSLTVGTDAVLWANARVKVATTTNVTLANPGLTAIDGITMESNDRILVKNQSAPLENGVYIWNGATSPMTRAADADTPTKRNGLTVQIQQGAEASAWWQYDGSTWQRRTAVRVATQSANVNLASPGANIDGIALAANDRILVNAQTNPVQNGIYIWNGAATAMTRATDADAASELAGALVLVREGTDAGRTFRQTTLAAPATIESAAVQWAAIDPSPRFTIDVWILVGDSSPVQIAAMKNTTRSMSVLYPGFTAHLHDAPTIAYPFRNVRMGFTVGQRTSVTDQTFSISDFFTTWIE
jgi:hypothetical protein